jgi:hypothetical protein
MPTRRGAAMKKPKSHVVLTMVRRPGAAAIAVC